MPPILPPASLEADCSRCVALCCVLLAFDRSEAFAFDKASGVACQHLVSGWRCGIHDDLLGEGCGGCAAYDCQGAGPRAVELLGLEPSSTRWWGDEPAMSVVAEVFGVLRTLHELLAYLQDAAAFVTTAQRSEAARIAARVEAAAVSTSREELLSLDVGALAREVHAFLRGLATSVPQVARGKRLPILNDEGAQAPRAPSVVGPKGASGRCSTRKSTKVRTLGES